MSKLSQIINQFKDVQIEADLSVLSEDIQKALPHLANAMDMITRIFLKQQHNNLPSHFDEIMSGTDEERIKFYELFKGPYNPLTDYKSEFKEVRDRRKGCGFYPDALADEAILEKSIFFQKRIRFWPEITTLLSGIQ